jgi:hypothetical protein
MMVNKVWNKLKRDGGPARTYLGMWLAGQLAASEGSLKLTNHNILAGSGTGLEFHRTTAFSLKFLLILIAESCKIFRGFVLRTAGKVQRHSMVRRGRRQMEKETFCFSNGGRGSNRCLEVAGLFSLWGAEASCHRFRFRRFPPRD